MQNVTNFIEDRWVLEKHSSFLGMEKDGKYTRSFQSHSIIERQDLLWNQTCITEFRLDTARTQQDAFPKVMSCKSIVSSFFLIMKDS